MNQLLDQSTGGHPDRDTLLLVAEIVSEGEVNAARYTVRNLSPGGMLAQGDHLLAAGARVTIALRNLAPVTGRVAWADGARYGIAFDCEIDPRSVRAPVALAEFLSDTIKLRPRRQA